MKIKIYTNSSCPHCIKAKNFLKENGLKFKEINLTSYPSAAKELMRITGQTGVPVIFAGGHKIIGFDEDKLRRILKIK